MSKLSLAYGALKLNLHAKSPTLLVVGGVVVMGAAAVLACKQTTQLEGVIEPHVEQLEKIENARKTKPELKDGGNYSDEVARSDRTITYSKAGRDVAKLYAVPAALFLGGAVMVFRGHHLLQQRNAALAVAFTALKKSFDRYRERVVKEQGHEADQHFMNSSTAHTFTTGAGYPMQTATRDWDTSAKDPYNRVFSNETSSKWQNDLGTNKHYIQSIQRYAQQTLNHRGYIYLSEIYTSLGLPESDISRVVGWKIQMNENGDRTVPIVDFGLDKPLPDDWKYNQQRAVFLDFNCDGLIVGGKLQQILEQA